MGKEKRERGRDKEGEDRKIRRKGKKGGMVLPCSKIHYCIFCNGSTIFYILPVRCRGLISVLLSCLKTITVLYLKGHECNKGGEAL